MIIHKRLIHSKFCIHGIGKFNCTHEIALFLKHLSTPCIISNHNSHSCWMCLKIINYDEMSTEGWAIPGGGGLQIV